MTLLELIGWELVLGLPLIILIGFRLMAKFTDIQASLTSLEGHVAQLVPQAPPAATEAQLDEVNARIQAADARVTAVLTTQPA